MMNIKILYLILSIYIFIKTTSYALYEYKTKENKIAGITISFFNIMYIILSNILVFIR